MNSIVLKPNSYKTEFILRCKSSTKKSTKSTKLIFDKQLIEQKNCVKYHPGAFVHLNLVYQHEFKNNLKKIACVTKTKNLCCSQFFSQKKRLVFETLSYQLADCLFNHPVCRNEKINQNNWIINELEIGESNFILNGKVDPAQDFRIDNGQIFVRILLNMTAIACFQKQKQT